MTDLGSLAGKKAVVAGAVGAHSATVIRALRKQGAAVVAVGRSADELDRLALALGADASDIALHVVEETETGAARALAELGSDHPLDILVTCPPPVAEMPGSHVHEALAEALEPAFHWTAAATDVMRERGTGVIVHLTGLSGLGGWRGWLAGATAFSGIHGLVRTFALELAPHGVRVNALVPGVTAAQGAVVAAASGQSIDAVRARIPLGAWMSEQDLGNALIYLVHPSSSYVTGEILAVDGGWDMWGRLHAVAAK